MDEYDQVLSELALLNAEANEEAVIIYQNELEEEEEKMYAQLVYTYESYNDYNYEEWN
jgi:hypothetical protein